jgi:hypothetical protein
MMLHPSFGCPVASRAVGDLTINWVAWVELIIVNSTTVHRRRDAVTDFREMDILSVKQLTGAGGKLKQLRAQLGNDIAVKAFREGKLPFPDGSIIAALHWKEASSDADNKVLAEGFPGAGLPLQSLSWRRL